MKRGETFLLWKSSLFNRMMSILSVFKKKSLGNFSISTLISLSNQTITSFFFAYFSSQDLFSGLYV